MCESFAVSGSGDQRQGKHDYGLANTKLNERYFGGQLAHSKLNARYMSDTRLDKGHSDERQHDHMRLTQQVGDESDGAATVAVMLIML